MNPLDGIQIMNKYDIRRVYEQNGPDAALEVYRKVIEENKGQEDKLNALAIVAASFAHPEALELLFEQGASSQIIGEYGFTLLHYLALQKESYYYSKPKGAVAQTTALLLDHKVSALRKDDNESMTCYHYAARNGLFEMVQTMAERGVKLNMTDKEGHTGIHIVCVYVKSAISRISDTQKNVERSIANVEKETKRMKERGMSDEQIAASLKNDPFLDPERAPREYNRAVQHVENYFLTVKAFAQGGVDVDEKNAYGVSALDIAVKSDAKKIAAYLSGTLTNEDDEAAITAGGMTLHQAAEKGDVEAIKALVAAGADLNGLKDGDKNKHGGCTPLAIACAFLQANAVEALLACGADPSFKDSNGQTAAGYLGTDLVSSLNRGIFDEKRIPNIIKNLVSAGMDINMSVNDNSDTLLIFACKMSRGTPHNRNSVKTEIIDQTMKHNPDLNLKNHFGETALMYASSRDFDLMENIQLDLLEKGADVSAADKNGNTALHYAARTYDKNAAKILSDMLLEFGADAKAVNNAGETALDIATKQDNEPLVKLLLSKM
ncbi:MAG: ankyrin repeat domain-containing protein [Methanimicrococcus sp.]|nr:ankyrin repeat domain-containing protein [Methanimicrococcus sp.]